MIVMVRVIVIVMGMVMRDDSHGEGDSDGYEYAR